MHTKTPWEVSRYGLTQLEIMNENGTQIAVLQNHTDGRNNAAFIVKAVNNHEALVELLKLTLNRSDGLVYLHHINPKCGEGGTEICPDCLNDRIRAALEKIEEG